MSSSIKTWSADLYDSRIGYVSQYGKEVVKLLNPQKGERILDLGCGTGDLTAEIAKAGAIPLGIDLSAPMLEKARQKYPHLEFLAANGETFRTAEKFDAVFSNAALHWMKQADKVVGSVWLALDTGGRFVAEFGGKGNTATIINAVTDILAGYGISTKELNPWYYPGIGEYSTLLEKQGFSVRYALYFERPTPLEDGENGLKTWLNMFCDIFFQGLSQTEKDAAYDQITKKLKPKLFRDGSWVADCRRLRIIAVKE